MPQYELRPFAIPESEMIASWISSPAELLRFDGSEDFPVTVGHVTAWTYEASFAFTLRLDGDLVAYGEILEDEVDGDVEIQHILVAPDARSHGVGKVMIAKLCAFLAAARPYEEVWLRISRDNEPALHCIQAVGFEEEAAQSGDRYLWLKKSLASASPL